MVILNRPRTIRKSLMDRTEYFKQYRETHKQHYQDYDKQYRETHRQQYADNLRRWRKQNPDKAKKHSMINAKKWNKTIEFKGITKYIRQNPRVGVCNICRAVVGIDCKRTDMHHINYHDDDPLKDTIELCVSCHRKIHIKSYVVGGYT